VGRAWERSGASGDRGRDKGPRTVVVVEEEDVKVAFLTRGRSRCGTGKLLERRKDKVIGTTTPNPRPWNKATQETGRGGNPPYGGRGFPGTEEAPT